MFTGYLPPDRDNAFSELRRRFDRHAGGGALSAAQQKQAVDHEPAGPMTATPDRCVCPRGVVLRHRIQTG